MNPGPIILTGAGGDIGIALARVLRETLPGTTVIGADCNQQAVGAEFVDRFYRLPSAGERGFTTALASLVEASGAKLVIPLAEAELARLAAEGRLGGKIAGAAIITPNAKAVETGLDKLATARVLQEAGIAVPESGIVGKDMPGDFDCIIKPRSGQGSKGIAFTARQGFAALAQSRKGDLWQRWLKNEGEEYTCGLARFSAMPTRLLAFRRALQGGLTGSGEVVHDPRIEQICERVADVLELDGAINIQLRIDSGEPTIFEINPRFSSTVGFRHRLGFCDAIWAIKARLGLPIDAYTPPLAGTRIERVAQEIIRPPSGM